MVTFLCCLHKKDISIVIIINYKYKKLKYPNSPRLLVVGMILAVGVLVGIFISFFYESWRYEVSLSDSVFIYLQERGCSRFNAPPPKWSYGKVCRDNVFSNKRAASAGESNHKCQSQHLTHWPTWAHRLEKNASAAWFASFCSIQGCFVQKKIYFWASLS